jgi:hypothetical protein
MSRPIVEPSADLRQAAAQMRQMFIALLNEGFEERQALAILGQVIAAGSKQQDQ